MQSAVVNPGVMEEYLERECSPDRIVGPVDPKKMEMQVSRFDVMPKGHQIGKWRLILDLSHPEAASVNDGIDQIC